VVRYFDEENSKEAKRIAEYIKSETSIEISTAKIIYDTGGSLKGKYKVWLNK